MTRKTYMAICKDCGPLEDYEDHDLTTTPWEFRFTRTEAEKLAQDHMRTGHLQVVVGQHLLDVMDIENVFDVSEKRKAYEKREAYKARCLPQEEGE